MNKNRRTIYSELGKQNMKSWKSNKVKNFKRNIMTRSINGHYFTIQINKNGAIHNITEIDKQGNNLGRFPGMMDYFHGRQFTQDTFNTIHYFVE